MGTVRPDFNPTPMVLLETKLTEVCSESRQTSMRNGCVTATLPRLASSKVTPAVPGSKPTFVTTRPVGCANAGTLTRAISRKYRRRMPASSAYNHVPDSATLLLNGMIAGHVYRRPVEETDRRLPLHASTHPTGDVDRGRHGRGEDDGRTALGPFDRAAEEGRHRFCRPHHDHHPRLIRVCRHSSED